MREAPTISFAHIDNRRKLQIGLRRVAQKRGQLPTERGRRQKNVLPDSIAFGTNRSNLRRRNEDCLPPAARSAFVAESGLDVVGVTPPELVPALIRGDVQAFFSWEPWSTKAVEIGGKDKVHLLASSGDVDRVTRA